MPVIEKSALLPYSAEQMFTLVNDVESYPEYMGGCVSVTLLNDSDNILEAELVLGKAGLKYAFTTRNILEPNKSMEMQLVEGPFKKFEARWSFDALREDACKTSLYMVFEFSSGLVDFALRSLFESVSNNLVAAVCERAEVIYGK